MTGLPAASFTRIAPPTGIASTLASDAVPDPVPPAEEAPPATGVVVLPLEPQATSTPAPPTASAATPAPPRTVRRDRLAAPIAPPRPREASARSVSSKLLVSRSASRIVALHLSGDEALVDHCSTLPTTDHSASGPASRRALDAGGLVPNG